MASSKIFNIDFGRLVRWFTPKELRTGTVLSFLWAMTRPIVWIYTSFLRYKKDKEYQLMITPQVCYLERLLNDRFDRTQRRITIDEAVWFQPWYLFQEEELKPEYLYQESEDNPVALFTDGEAGDIKDDFIVLIPLAITFDENELRSLLNGYRLAGKRYKVERI